jgi:hypothetical protein
MATVVTVRWLTPPPSSVDERLVVTDEGLARLDVLRPRTPSGSIGSFQARIDEADVRALAATGPNVELNLVVQDPAVAAVAVAADRVARDVRNSPLAVADFSARPAGPSADGRLTLVLLVTGQGSQPVQFQLDVAQSAVHYSTGGQPVAWYPLPELPMGFMTVNADGLGGVRQRALVSPGVLGAISLTVPAPAGAAEVSAQLLGSWFLPDDPFPADFEARTEPVPLPAG